MFELHFVTRTIRATSACAKQPKIGKIASFSEKRVICQFIICVEALRKNKGVGTMTCKLCQKTLKWNGSTTSSLKGPLRLQVKLCCQHRTHIIVANTYFSFDKSLITIWFYLCSHYLRIFDYSCCGYRIIQFARNELSFHPCSLGC